MHLGRIMIFMEDWLPLRRWENITFLGIKLFSCTHCNKVLFIKNQTNTVHSYRLLPKICDLAKYQSRHSSKNIRVTKLSLSQSDSPMSESFWQKNSLVIHIFFDLWPFKHFSPVANFGLQSLYIAIAFKTFATKQGLQKHRLNIHAEKKPLW